MNDGITNRFSYYIISIAIILISIISSIILLPLYLSFLPLLILLSMLSKHWNFAVSYVDHVLSDVLANTITVITNNPNSKVHGANMGPTWVGPKWAPCWPHEPCYQGPFFLISGIIICLVLFIFQMNFTRINFQNAIFVVIFKQVFIPSTS